MRNWVRSSDLNCASKVADRKRHDRVASSRRATASGRCQWQLGAVSPGPWRSETTTICDFNAIGGGGINFAGMSVIGASLLTRPEIGRGIFAMRLANACHTIEG